MSTKGYREQYLECKQSGNAFTVTAPQANLPIIICGKFKTYCHSGACRNERAAKDICPGCGFERHWVCHQCVGDGGLE